MEAGEGLCRRDLVYLSSWTSSLNIQLMGEEAVAAKYSHILPVETVNRESTDTEARALLPHPPWHCLQGG